jgi:hypothetical protein
MIEKKELEALNAQLEEFISGCMSEDITFEDPEDFKLWYEALASELFKRVREADTDLIIVMKLIPVDAGEFSKMDFQLWVGYDWEEKPDWATELVKDMPKQKSYKPQKRTLN